MNKVIKTSAALLLAILCLIACPMSNAYAADEYCNLIQSPFCEAALSVGEQLTIESRAGISNAMYIVNAESSRGIYAAEVNVGFIDEASREWVYADIPLPTVGDNLTYIKSGIENTVSFTTITTVKNISDHDAFVKVSVVRN